MNVNELTRAIEKMNQDHLMLTTVIKTLLNLHEKNGDMMDELVKSELAEALEQYGYKSE